MKQVHGIYFPDGDAHFEPHLRDSPRIKGKATYQYTKYLKAKEYVRRFNFAVDVGGHVGLWSHVMSCDFALVWAFEPLAAHRECFWHNVDLTNVELFDWAISDVDYKKINIDMPYDNTGHSHVSAKGELIATTRTLDDISFPHKVDFLKIDVEGYETRVVRGAEKTIRGDRPTIIIEQKPNNAEFQGFRQHQARDLLLSWGMREVSVISGDHILVW